MAPNVHLNKLRGTKLLQYRMVDPIFHIFELFSILLPNQSDSIFLCKNINYEHILLALLRNVIANNFFDCSKDLDSV